MILTGPAIRAAIARGDITITPLIDNDDDSQIDQAGVTLHLHPTVLEDVEPTTAILAGGLSHERIIQHIALDVRKDNSARLRPVERMADGAFFLRTGRHYLGATIERVHAPRHVVRVDGKSSLGRLWLPVHVTAGHVEPGFRGQITLEMVPGKDILVAPGWPICQAVFYETTGEVEGYTERGHYADAARTDGPQPSRSHLHKPRHV